MATFQSVAAAARTVAGIVKSLKAKSDKKDCEHNLGILEKIEGAADLVGQESHDYIMSLVRGRTFRTCGEFDGGKEFTRAVKRYLLPPIEAYQADPTDAALMLVMDGWAKLAVWASETCCNVAEDDTQLMFDIFAIAAIWLDEKLSPTDKAKKTADRVRQRGGIGSRVWASLDEDERALVLPFLDPEDPLGLGIGGTIEDMINTIREYIEGILDNITQWIEGVVSAVTDSIASAVSAAVDAMTEAWTVVTDSVAEFFDDLGLWFDDLLARLSGAIDAAISTLADAASSLFDTVTQFIGDAIDQVTGYIGDAIDTIKATAEDLYAGAVELADRIASSFQELIDATVGAANDAFSTLSETVADIPKTLREFAEGAGALLSETIGKPLTELPGSIPGIIGDALRKMIEGDEKQLDDATKMALLGERFVVTQREEFRELFNKTMPTSPILRFAANMMLGLFVLMKVGGGIADAQAQIILQEFALSTPFQVLTPADAIRAERFGRIERNAAIEAIRKQGYSDQDARTLVDSAEVLPDVGELLSWWLRGLITDGELDAYLLKHGMSAESISRLRDASFFIPPPADLVTMAVREAFSPETAEKFGQFEDFPADFATYAKQQGISEDWAKRYWAAHWGLPSPQQGFEMFQRRIIDEETLKMLLKALDVMPFWRDKMIQLSYNVLTRVDVRRMHELGVLDDDGVRNAYLDMGYSPQNADALLTFTKKLNEPKTADDDTELEQLTRSSVLNFYDDGVIDRERAATLLTGLGVSRDAADLYLDAADMADERRERKAEIDLIIEQAKVGALDFGEAEDALNALELEETEKTKALTALMRAEKAKTRQPSRAELAKFYLAGIIDRSELQRELSRLGWSTKWVNRWVDLIDKGGGVDA